MPESVIETSSDAPPDWANLSTEILCPLCNYNLRGLVEPRCPECGYRSTWRDLIQQKNLLHPYLFEHHPERNVGSFLHTLMRSVLLIGFWRHLKPGHTPNRRRLLIYWLCVSLSALLSIVLLYCPAFFLDRAMHPGIQVGAGQFILDFVGACEYFALVPLVIFALAWPWASAGMLLLFREAIRAARIKPIHVLRASIYSADVTILAVPLLVIGWIDPLERTEFARTFRLFWASRDEFSTAAATVYILGAILLFVRMIVAARCYLRLPGAIGLAIMSQLFILLAMTKALQIWLMW